jgi:hypothetical protein
LATRRRIPPFCEEAAKVRRENCRVVGEWPRKSCRRTARTDRAAGPYGLTTERSHMILNLRGSFVVLAWRQFQRLWYRGQFQGQFPPQRKTQLLVRQ